MKKQFKMGYILTLASITMSLNAQVDTALKNTYNNETIILDANANKYVKNNERKRIGLFGKKIEKEFNNVSPDTKKELEIYKKQRRLGTATLAVGGTIIVTLGVIAPMITAPAFMIAFFSGTGAYTISSISHFKSRRHLQKAVWLRNRDVLVKN